MTSISDRHRYICPPLKKNCTKPNYDLTIEVFIGIICSLLFSLPVWLVIAVVILWLT